MKTITILGATGSIGTNAIDVVASHPSDFSVHGIAVKSNAAKGLDLALKTHAEVLAVEDVIAAAEIEVFAKAAGIRLIAGPDAATLLAGDGKASLVLVSLVGASGFKPVLAAIDAGCDIALATKEVMVMAGELVTSRAHAKGVKIIPVDSEHSAIFQCLQENRYDKGHLLSPDRLGESVEKLILTASGGPFLDEPVSLDEVTPSMALNHPRWKMGPKVTIDSSTMMNKGFEVLEARWLFNIPVSRIDVVVHPESVVHSLVTYIDGATLAQLSPPDMRIPIQYAMSWPSRLPAKRAILDLPSLGSLTFRSPDLSRFPCLRLVKEACESGGTATAALSAADEVAVESFLAGRIKYTDIAKTIECVLSSRHDRPCDSLDEIIAADAEARDLARSFLG